AGVLRRLHARRDLRHAGFADRHGQRPDAAGAQEDARSARARGGGDMTHEHWEDATGAYVLGALPDDERAVFEAHLETGALCRAEADELRVAAQALPLSGPPVLPPPALKARIMAEVEREAALLGNAREAAPRKAPRRWTFSRLPMPAVALACAALIAGVV